MKNGDHTVRSGMRAYGFWMYLAAATLTGKAAFGAQDWQTVDDFALASGDAEAHAVAVDGAKHIYVVGTANGHAIVRSSTDGGTTWSTRDDFVHPPETNYPSYTNNLYNAITIDSHDDVFVGGAGAAFMSGIRAGHWIVRRSRDHGISWETVDDFWQRMNGPGEPGTNASVYSLSSDGQGRVYGAGLLLQTGPSYPQWWVRGSDIGGTNWDSKLVVFAGYGGVSQLTWAGEDVYVTGSVSWYTDSATIGLTERSSDYGATWTTNLVTTNEFFYAINSDSAGNVYSAGNALNPSSVDWRVRKAAPGGADWTIIDQVTYEDTCGCGVSYPRPRSIAVDPVGNICVAGEYQERWIINQTNGATYGANQKWFTRQYSAASGQWNTTDLFSYSTNATSSTNTHTVAMGTAIAADGTTFVVGYGTTESGQHRWVVRKRAAVRPPPRLEIANVGGIVSVFWPGTYTNSTLEWTDSSGTNQVWRAFSGPVSKADGQNTVNLELIPGAQFFRLKSAVGQ